MVEHGAAHAASAVTQSVRGAQRAHGNGQSQSAQLSSVSLSAVSDDPKSEMHGSFSNGISHFHLTRESSGR